MPPKGSKQRRMDEAAKIFEISEPEPESSQQAQVQSPQPIKQLQQATQRVVSLSTMSPQDIVALAMAVQKTIAQFMAGTDSEEPSLTSLQPTAQNPPATSVAEQAQSTIITPPHLMRTAEWPNAPLTKVTKKLITGIHDEMTHTSPPTSQKKMSALIKQFKPSDPKFIARSTDDAKISMRDSWRPDDWRVGLPKGADTPQNATHLPQFGECEHWLLYQQFFKVTPYTLPPKNCFLSSFDLYQWLKLAHIDGLVSPYSLHLVNSAFSKANGYLLTHMRPMGRGVYTKVNGEICVVVFSGYYVLCGDVGVQAWMIANPKQSLALDQPWAHSSISVGRALVEMNTCKIFNAVPLQKTRFACFLDPSVSRYQPTQKDHKNDERRLYRFRLQRYSRDDSRLHRRSQRLFR